MIPGRRAGEKAASALNMVWDDAIGEFEADLVSIGGAGVADEQTGVDGVASATTHSGKVAFFAVRIVC